MENARTNNLITWYICMKDSVVNVENADWRQITKTW